MRFVRYITDCSDPNASLRLGIKGATLWRATPQVYGVASEYEAAGMLVDALDVANGSKGVILVNVAPRNGQGKQYPNGIPFGYFRVGETLVVTTIGAKTLSLVSKLDIISTIHVLDIERVSQWAVEQRLITRDEADRMRTTQFRSLNFAPVAAKWVGLWHGLPYKECRISDLVPEQDGDFVWFVDCFGNCKTSLLPSQANLLAQLGGTSGGVKLPSRCFSRLSDVPDDGQLAWITGSSGSGVNRFLELVLQGGSAAEAGKLCVGSTIQAR